MRDLLKVLAVGVVAFGLAAAVVLYGGDTTVAVPPPEAVAEQFARAVASRRYDRALRYIDRDSGITFTTVRLAGEALHESGGQVDNVEGEPGRIEDRQATASALLQTSRVGRVRYMLRFTRRHGVWKIVEWDEVP